MAWARRAAFSACFLALASAAADGFLEGTAGAPPEPLGAAVAGAAAAAAVAGFSVGGCAFSADGAFSWAGPGVGPVGATALIVDLFPSASWNRRPPRAPRIRREFLHLMRLVGRRYVGSFLHSG
ncbi:hypothetical protein MAPG_07730 [Magnaporthiopsis poae ATCC 64411]|uniref:Uncharacterized protein n=1 Tax=Magnaporthiopsis poae (strain ATCC 64411 / 73-15) TaxID=644358 RepID=A0A0C4E5G4_MAGP6|nr:hypothetical protein MAPG_07730 [Magnaporthiopsis poae ATCC 64411]